MANSRTSPAVSPYVHSGRYKFPHVIKQPLTVIPVQTLPRGLCLPREANGTETPQQNGRGNAHHQIQWPASTRAVIATYGDWILVVSLLAALKEGASIEPPAYRPVCVQLKRWYCKWLWFLAINVHYNASNHVSNCKGDRHWSPVSVQHYSWDLQLKCLKKGHVQ